MLYNQETPRNYLEKYLEIHLKIPLDVLSWSSPSEVLQVMEHLVGRKTKLLVKYT